MQAQKNGFHDICDTFLSSIQLRRSNFVPRQSRTGPSATSLPQLEVHLLAGASKMQPDSNTDVEEVWGTAALHADLKFTSAWFVELPLGSLSVLRILRQPCVTDDQMRSKMLNKAVRFSVQALWDRHIMKYFIVYFSLYAAFVVSLTIEAFLIVQNDYKAADDPDITALSYLDSEPWCYITITLTTALIIYELRQIQSQWFEEGFGCNSAALLDPSTWLEFLGDNITNVFQWTMVF